MKPLIRRRRAPDIVVHYCIRCGNPGPFLDRRAKLCLICGVEPAPATISKKDVWRARSLALATLRANHPLEYERLFAQARERISRERQSP